MLKSVFGNVQLPTTEHQNQSKIEIIDVTKNQTNNNCVYCDEINRKNKFRKMWPTNKMDY